jgi:hypothetical protein
MTRMHNRRTATEAAELIDEACRRSGLDDFGERDPAPALERFIDSVDQDARLADPFRTALFEQVVGYLVNRLEVEDWHKRCPDIGREQIRAPVFGVGLPRTASTLAVSLLAQDPATRSLRWWEAARPCPPPTAETQHDDPRIAEARAAYELQQQVIPELTAMVPIEPTGPMECNWVLAHQMTSMHYFVYVDAESYVRWVISDDCDMGPAYRHHRQVLQLLQWRCPPKRWNLKGPQHMFHLHALDSVYPDARFVVTHREPATVLVSLARLAETLHKVYGGGDRRRIGRFIVGLWEEGLRRLIAFRDENGNDERFFDIHFEPFMADRLGTMRAVYDWLGWEFTPAAEAGIRRWQERNPQQPNPYSAADYGLDADEIRERFSFYTTRFGVT